jgi:PAS domain-containing protein
VFDAAAMPVFQQLLPWSLLATIKSKHMPPPSLAPRLQSTAPVELTRGQSESASAVAKRCSPIAPTAFIAGTEAELRAEIERLKRLVEQAQRDKLTSSETEQLLQSVIDQLSIALTVQDENGRFILANSPAATSISIPLERLVGASPADFLSEHEARARREWEERVIREQKSVTVEDNTAGPHGGRT